MQHYEVKKAPVYTIGQTIRTECGKGRITYQYDWSACMPWAAYINGTATRHFADVASAESYFLARGMRLNTLKVD